MGRQKFSISLVKKCSCLLVERQNQPSWQIRTHKTSKVLLEKEKKIPQSVQSQRMSRRPALYYAALAVLPLPQVQHETDQVMGSNARSFLTQGPSFCWRPRPSGSTKHPDVEWEVRTKKRDPKLQLAYH